MKPLCFLFAGWFRKHWKAAEFKDRFTSVDESLTKSIGDLMLAISSDTQLKVSQIQGYLKRRLPAIQEGLSRLEKSMQELREEVKEGFDKLDQHIDSALKQATERSQWEPGTA